MGAKAMSSHGSGGGGGAVSRQGSVCSLTFGDADAQLHGVNLDDLLRAGRKTVDEVWRDIQGAAACPRAQMTLEDFLSRAAGPGTGAPADAGARGWAHQLYQPGPAPQLGHHHHPAVGRPVPWPLGVGAGPVLDALYYDGHEGGGAAAAAGGKRAGPERGVAERSNERRKKRMIKNRESAARSRARKQAYTKDLEIKISQLEEENLRLRGHKAPEPVAQYVPPQEVKSQLRRTNSANF
ncbi:hypothetical protein PAHAL_9G483500 [Panicum hallii]|uniref:BZIP domain-containing protein n=1 Tax=Panicum hallii TaxID=206008 RepID=A0A2T8I527_9POAL|nr:ABSCISIC ACID-INSENSITIVE 5-like protein 2 [Panicum hallii]PVH32776.1 hypothetical protein PAHAL_9G483500 [Panicum hallii]